MVIAVGRDEIAAGGARRQAIVDVVELIARTPEAKAKSRELGMQTFDQHLFDLYEAGEISYEDALRNADSMNELRLMIKLNSKDAKDKDVMTGIEHLNLV